MAPKANPYAGLPNLIFGRTCSQHRKQTISQVLNHFRVQSRRSETKVVLLGKLAALQERASEANSRVIEAFFEPRNGEPYFEVFAMSYQLRHGGEDEEEVEEDDEGEEENAFPDDMMEIDEQQPNTKECTICAEYVDNDQFRNLGCTPRCTHEMTFCNGCLTQTIDAQIESLPWDRIHCPECPALMTFQFVKEVASPEAFIRYDRKTVLAVFATMPNFTYCLNPSCDSGQIHDSGDEQPIMTCTTCSFKTCYTHKMPWHEGLTCSQFDESRQDLVAQEAASTQYLNQNTKICPNIQCGLRCEKISGCDHMTCHRCRHEFCWECFAPYERIHIEGNSAHEETCKYHSNRLPLWDGIWGRLNAPILRAVAARETEAARQMEANREARRREVANLARGDNLPHVEVANMLTQ
ncbi:hypothetical protein B0J14DRAFT_489716 [Halenospora varia]|nr:hypothetical protein B0J14DRAFT_489716 [Halenospora varia]